MPLHVGFTAGADVKCSSCILPLCFTVQIKKKWHFVMCSQWHWETLVYSCKICITYIPTCLHSEKSFYVSILSHNIKSITDIYCKCTLLCPNWGILLLQQQWQRRAIKGRFQYRWVENAAYLNIRDETEIMMQAFDMFALYITSYALMHVGCCLT